MKLHQTAGCVLFNTKLDKVFLIHKIERDEWLLPKGHIEDGETILAGAKREVYEETGYLDFVLLGQAPVTTNEFEFEGKNGDTEKKIIYIFPAILLSTSRDETSWMEEEGLEGEWFTVDEALEKASFDDIKLAIQKANEKIKNCGHRV